MPIRYFDHAASSWPKPPAVIEAMNKCMNEYAANPGRGGHQMAVAASRTLFDCRKNLANLFGVKNPNDICYALNTSMALNQAILGTLRPGDHVISTGVEHNSVRRPLEYLKETAGVQVTYLPLKENGEISVRALEESIQSNTCMIACTHSSNLLGSIIDIAKIGEIAKKHQLLFLVDAAQSAGTLPIDVQSMGIHLLAFPGHKGLLGPQGTGGLYIHPEVDLNPLLHGGTGSQSEAILQPTVRPDRYETGTQNTVGIAGLNEGVKFVLNETVETIHNKEWALAQRIMVGLQGIEGISLLGPSIGEPRTGIVSFVCRGIDSSELAFILDQSFEIAVRAGYHCSPLAHETAGTLETGAVRASVGYYTTDDDVEYFIESMKQICKHYR